MYKISGDGSYQHTKVERDGVGMGYVRCDITINEEKGMATVDGVEGAIDNISLVGIYSIVGSGKFSSTTVCLYDVAMRGIQDINVKIEKEKHSIFFIAGIFLPNIVD